MIRSMFPITLLLSSAAIAQETPAPPPIAVPQQVATLRDQALDDDYAWNLVEGLTTEVGARIAGSPAEARARDWAVARLKTLGFTKVRIDTFPIPYFQRGPESAEILAPFPQGMAVTALGGSGVTDAGGVTGEIIAFDSVDSLRLAPDRAVQGKIVFIDHRMARTQNGLHYGQFGAPRREGPSVASSKGASAIVVRSIGTDNDRTPHTGMMRFTGGAQPIPAGALSVPDAEQLARILKRGKPVTMKLVLQGRTTPSISGNVIAEVPGRDPSLAPVLVSGHLDSWDLGTGAVDDAAGVAIVAAAAKRIMDRGRPLRTIRIVWFGAEETGLYGGFDYQKRYGKLPHYAIAESDFGAGRVWKVDSRLGPDRRQEARALGAALAPLGIAIGSFETADGSDIGPMIEDGLPAISLSQDGTYYFDLHHTANDTLDKIDRDDLRQNVAAWTAMLAVLAGPVEPLKRPRRR